MTKSHNAIVNMDLKKKQIIVQQRRKFERLPIDQEVPGSNPGYTLRFFSSGEFSTVWVFLCFSVPVHVLPCVVFGGGPCTLLATVQGTPSNCVRVYDP